MNIPDSGTFHAYAMIVDLNHFTKMVQDAETFGDGMIAQFVRDVLDGAIQEIQKQGGEVVGFMGDAILGILPDGENAVFACWGIAKELDRQCEYISQNQEEYSYLWEYAPGGPSLKISVECGEINVSSISSRFLGAQHLLIGTTINYAARISSAGQGNRCIVGPNANADKFASYGTEGPCPIKGKIGEADYEYYKFDMGEVWIEGSRKPGKDTYWG